MQNKGDNAIDVASQAILSVIALKILLVTVPGQLVGVKVRDLSNKRIDSLRKTKNSTVRSIKGLLVDHVVLGLVLQ